MCKLRICFRPLRGGWSTSNFRQNFCPSTHNSREWTNSCKQRSTTSVELESPLKANEMIQCLAESRNNMHRNAIWNSPVWLNNQPDVLVGQDPLHSGFRLEFRTETVLVILVDDLYQDLDRDTATLLDLLVDFDTINHSILLSHLSAMELKGTLLQWFKSYLGGWYQKVVLGDTCYAMQLLACGVSWYSNLSPT